MRNKLIIIMLSFFCFCIPSLAVDFPSATCHTTHKSTLKALYKDGKYKVFYSDYLFAYANNTICFSSPKYCYYTLESGSTDWVYTYKSTGTSQGLITSADAYAVWSNNSDYNTLFANNGFTVNSDLGNLSPPPSPAPIVGDLTEFIKLIVLNMKTITIVGCLILSLMLLPNLVQRLVHKFL